MTNINFLSLRYRFFSVIGLNLVFIGIILFATETALHLFFPYDISTIGHKYSENAQRYGWGYNPYELVRIADPDTKEVYDSYTNQSGWRDINHLFDNPGLDYRIVVLGDSNTFGAIVPAEKIYTRVLENELKGRGFDVEIISLAYGGWGTDQQLEALINEGLYYSPNLVILQFTTNDLSENLFALGSEPCSKPFYYALDRGRLKRYQNDCFEDRKDSIKDYLKLIISKFELLKRAYGIYLGIRLVDLFGEGYIVSDNKIGQLKTVFGFEQSSEFLKDLEQLESRPNQYDLERIIDRHNLGESKVEILRVLEDRWFNRNWSKEKYEIPAPDVDSTEWKLFFKLLLEISNRVKNSGAKLAILSDNEIGQYYSEVYWFRLKNDRMTMKNYLAPTEMIKKFAKKNGIDLIENEYPVNRARNDPHPNIVGNEAMAKNICKYLQSNQMLIPKP